MTIQSLIPAARVVRLANMATLLILFGPSLRLASLAGPPPGLDCLLEDVSPGPGSRPDAGASTWGRLLSLSLTGIEKASGPASSWISTNNDTVVEHLAAADEHGNLMVFYRYPPVFLGAPGSDWKAVRVSEKAGPVIAMVRPESWVFAEAPNLVFERVAAPSPSGDLLLFTWHTGSDWEAANLSRGPQRQISGPVTSWQVPGWEHIAAQADNNDLLVFYRPKGGTWAMRNVTGLTQGQQVSAVGTSWAVQGLTEWAEYVAAPSPSGDLLLFRYLPSTDWTVQNLSQQAQHQPVKGAVTHWTSPTGLPTEYLAAHAPDDSLVLFYSDPIDNSWRVKNLSDPVTGTGQKVSDSPTSWLVDLGGGNWWEHIAAPGPDGHLYVFHRPSGGAWQVVDVTGRTAHPVKCRPASWVMPPLPLQIFGRPENLAAPGWDNHLYVFSFTPALSEWSVADATIKASGRVVVAGSPDAGVWRSDDYGTTWVQSTHPQPLTGDTIGGLDVPEVLDVLVSPDDPNLVIAATGGDRRDPSHTGIYRSTDGGATWTCAHRFVSDGDTLPVTQIVFAPGDPTHVYAAAGPAIGVSTNSGESWREVPLQRPASGNKVYAWHIAMTAELPGEVRHGFACGDGMFWFSPDSGTNWYLDYSSLTDLPSGFGARTVTGNGYAAHILAVDPESPDRLYLAHIDRANGPSYFHPSSDGPDGVHCNNPVVYDVNDKGIYDSQDIVIRPNVPPRPSVTSPPQKLLSDTKLMFVDVNGNRVLDDGEAVVYDSNGDGLYSALGSNRKEVVLRGPEPAVGTRLSYDPRIKFVDVGGPLGPRGAGEGSLWYGDFSSFDPLHQPRASWSQLPGPPVFYGDGQSNDGALIGVTPSGGTYVFTQRSQHGHLVFFSDRSSVYVSVGKPTATGWHRLDGYDPSNCKRENLMLNRIFVHVDPHGLAISPDFDLTLKPVQDQPFPYNQNHELSGAWGRLWMANDGGVYRSDNGGQTWIPAFSGLSTLSVHNVAGLAGRSRDLQSPNPPPALYIGTGDNDDFFSLDGGVTWKTGLDDFGDFDTWYADPAIPFVFRHPARDDNNNAFAVFTSLYFGLGGLLSANLYPDPSQGIFKKNATYPPPAPPTTYERTYWAARGHRPVILTLAGETPSPLGDYLAVQTLLSAGQATAAILYRVKGDDLVSVGGGFQFVQEGYLPAANVVVQASGGHAVPIYYVSDNYFSNKGASLWKSHRDNQGKIDQWQPLVPGGGAQFANRFFVNPYDPNDLYLLDTKTVRHSTDGGLTWPPDPLLDAALTEDGAFVRAPDDFDLCVLNDMVFDRDYPQTRFALGLAGVFFSTNGLDWSRILDTRALPSRPLGAYFDPITDPKDPSLYVALHGRGVLRCHPIPARVAPGPTPPTVVQQPVTQAVALGGAVTLTAMATGPWPLSYQWQKNGANLAGETNAVLTLHNVGGSDLGSYTVIISNAAGSVTSQPALLTQGETFADDFGTGLNASAWQVLSNTPLYTVEATPGDVRFSKPADASDYSFKYVGLELRPRLRGDFEVAVDFRDASITRRDGAPGNQVQLNVLFGGQALIVVRSDEAAFPSGQNVHVYLSPPGVWAGALAMTNTAGRLRVTRTGLHTRAFFNDTLLYEADYNSADATVQFTLQNNGTRDATTVIFDNFTVSANAVLWPVHDFDATFDGLLLDPPMEDPANVYQRVSSEARNTGARNYLRTVATDFNTRDFTAEVIYTMNGGSWQAGLFFGLGAAEPDSGYLNEPLHSIYAVACSDFCQGLYVRSLPNSGSPHSFFDWPYPGLADGTNALRLIKQGDRLTFQMDYHYDAAGGFTNTYSGSLSLSNLPFLDASQSRLFVGTGPGPTPTRIRAFRVSTAPPRIDIAVGATLPEPIPRTIVISWPISADIPMPLPEPGWVPQVATSLAPGAADWTDIPPPYETNGNTLRLVVPAAENARFFRLHKR